MEKTLNTQMSDSSEHGFTFTLKGNNSLPMESSVVMLKKILGEIEDQFLSYFGPYIKDCFERADPDDGVVELTGTRTFPFGTVDYTFEWTVCANRHIDAGARPMFDGAIQQLDNGTFLSEAFVRVYLPALAD